jgi:hypothetical protein
VVEGLFSLSSPSRRGEAVIMRVITASGDLLLGCLALHVLPGALPRLLSALSLHQGEADTFGADIEVVVGQNTGGDVLEKPVRTSEGGVIICWCIFRNGASIRFGGRSSNALPTALIPVRTHRRPFRAAQSRPRFRRSRERDERAMRTDMSTAIPPGGVCAPAAVLGAMRTSATVRGRRRTLRGRAPRGCWRWRRA